MSFIDELKEKAALVPMSSHYVKEWDKTVYFRPVTPHETALVRARVTEADPGVYFSVGMVCLKALDEEGKRMFVNDDAKAMRDMPYQKAFITLAQKMQESVSIEDAEKN